MRLGWLRAEIIDATTADPVEHKHKGGFPAPGFALDQCDTFRGDNIAHVVWDGKSGVSALQKKPVRLRFVSRGARLYSFQFVR